MKFKLYILFFAGLSLMALSCKTASKLYEKGNYDEAVELAAKKLQKDPDDPKLLDIIHNAYTYAVNDHEGRIRSLSQSQLELKYEPIYNEYVSLQRMYEAIYKVPSVFGILNPVNYTDFVITYRQKASDVRYERGMALMQRYTKKSYQDAYREFQSALRLDPGHRDAALKLNEAYEYAVTNVVILPMQQQGGYVYSSYTVGGNNVDDQLVRDLQYNSGNPFVKFYNAWDARSRGIRIDQEVDLSISNMDIGRQYDTRTSRKVSKEVVVKEIVYKPDSVVREYAKVNANIITTRRNMNSSILLRVNILDEQGRRIWNDNIQAVHNWHTEYTTFTGDERALSESDKQLINKRPEFAPADTEIMRVLLEQVNNDVLYRIRNHFSRY